METALLATLAAALLALGLTGALARSLARSLAGQSRLERDLAATRADLALLRDRLDGLDHGPGRAPAADDRADYLITSLSDHPASVSAGPPSTEERASRREFAAVALSESVVKVAALAHGVRRALSPQSRNRIRFEMGREVKEARRQRRRAARRARRDGGPGPVLPDVGGRRADEAA